MDCGLLRIVSIFYSVAKVENGLVEVGSSLDWEVVPVDLDKRNCSSFDKCSNPFYECLFTQLNFMLPFSKIEARVLKHLKIAPSLLRPKSWAFVKVFEFWCE